MMDAGYEESEQWVVWNGTYGVVHMVSIGEVETINCELHAWLDEPFDMVGPFNFRELELNGHIEFEACVVMSRQKWQEDQVKLRRESLKFRKAAQERMNAEFERLNRQQTPSSVATSNDRQYRLTLELPSEGDIERSQIKQAYRRLAQKLHPDQGGTHEEFVRLTEARDALMINIESIQ